MKTRVFALGLLPSLWIFVLGFLNAQAATFEDPDYGSVIHPFLTKYCVGCHNASENEAGLQLHSYAAIRKGGESGLVLQPGPPDESLLWRRVSGLEEPKMPPSDAPQPSASELELLRNWIAAGAEGDDTLIPLQARWQLPKSPKSFRGKLPITAAAWVGPEHQLLLGSSGLLEIQRGTMRSRVNLEIIGKVTQIRPSPRGEWIVISSGIPGVGGQALVVKAASFRSDDRSDDDSVSTTPPEVLLRVEGHRDIIYSGVLSPDGRRLATAGYDRVIHVWDVATGTLERSLEGHNGAIYDLDFDDTGLILASASADETVKIWRVDTGERLDTLGQGEAEQYVVRLDTKRGLVLAAGADRRVRSWRIVSKEHAAVSPMLRSVFAHEAPVNQLTISPDGRWVATAGEDRMVKIFSAEAWSLMTSLDPIDDVATSLQWTSDGRQLWVTTLSGDIATRDVPDLLETIQTGQGTDVPPTATPTEPNEVVPVSCLENDTRRTRSSSQLLPTPSVVTATLSSKDMQGDDAGDWYSFDTRQGEEWIVSIDAARSGSPLDSMIDLYDESGQPMLRARLQAVRESYFTFRGKDSTNIDDFRLHRWEDMELNQLLYAGGEVVKLWLYPRGPDSGFKVYPGTGNRFTYFDTTATTHALNEPAWIVEPLPDGQAPKSNGLPVFPVYYANDDDATRQMGKDSRLHFVAPHAGRVVVRVRDARGQSGENYAYKLSILPPRPRFQFRLDTTEMTLRPNVGSEFHIAVERFDGMDDAIEIECVDLPPGVLQAGRLTVEPGQLRAIGQLRYEQAAFDTIPKEFEVSIRAKAAQGGDWIATSPDAKIKVRLSDQPAMTLKLVPRDASPDSPPISELRIRPGSTVTAQLVIDRGELQGDISLGGDDCGRNLPHGCYVDNIGLNGLLIPSGQSTREVFITAAPITHKQERLFHLRAQVDGNPTTLPVLLIVE